MQKHFLRLPFDFETQALLRDLRHCETSTWMPHFNTGDYSGGWTSISLRSASGNAEDILSHPGQAAYRDTPLLAQCPAIADVLHHFKCEMESVRLLNLHPAGHIKEHRDLQAGYQHGFFRVHVPLQTSDKVHFAVGGSAIPMQAGQAWYADFSQLHSVRNDGMEARVNLVIDCKRNPWSDKVFADAGYDFTAEARAAQPDAETRAKIIAQLSEMKTETAEALIRQLQAQA